MTFSSNNMNIISQTVEGHKAKDLYLRREVVGSFFVVLLTFDIEEHKVHDYKNLVFQVKVTKSACSWKND